MMKKCLVLLLVVTLCLTGCSLAEKIPTKPVEEDTQEVSREPKSTVAESTEASQPETKATEPQTEPKETETQAPETTPASEPALAAFEEAAAQFAEAKGYELSFEAEVRQSFAEEAYIRTETGTRKFLQEGDQRYLLELSEQVQDLADWSSEQAYTRAFKDGMALLEDEYGNVFSTTLCDWESYSHTLMPAILLDPAKYGTAGLGKTALELEFSGATEPEAWLELPEEAVLEEASGTVSLNAKGSLAAMTYRISYTLNQVPTTRSYAVTYKSLPADFQADMPDSSQALEVLAEDLRVMEWMNQADFGFYTRSLSAQLSQYVFTQAGGAEISKTQQLAWTGADQEDMLLLEDISQTVNTTTGSAENTARYLYQDGALTVTLDDQQPTAAEADAEALTQAERDFIAQFLFYPENCTEISLLDQGAAWLIKYTLNEDSGAYLSNLTQGSIYEDDTLLDQLAAGYRTETAAGFLSLEKETLFPINCGVDYQGYHKIEGQEWLLVQVTELALVPESANVYYEIFEENPGELTAPEETPTPLFYQVKDSAGHELYLLGTIHVGDTRTHFLPKEVYAALDQADFLAVECDIDEFSELMDAGDAEAMALYMAAYTYPDRSLPEAHMTEEEYEEFLDSLMTWGGWFMAERYPYNLAVYTSSVQSAFSNWSRQLYQNWGVDLHLLDYAKAKGTPVREVEDRAAHITLEASFPDKLSQWIFSDTAECSLYEYNDGVRELFEAWCRGDKEELEELCRDTYDEDCAEIDADPELTAAEKEEYKQLLKLYNDELMHKRNEIMLEAVKGYLAKGEKAFVAVGTAHLMGEDGLVQQLTAAGCEVSPVSYH